MKKIIHTLITLALGLSLYGQEAEIKHIDSLAENIRSNITQARSKLVIFGEKIDSNDDFTASFYIDTSSKRLLAVVQNELFTMEPDSGVFNAAPLIDTLTYTYYFRENQLVKVTVQQNIGQQDMISAVFYFKENTPFHKVSITQDETTVIDEEDDVTPLMVKRSEFYIQRSKRVIY